jgi:hypothetical protein
LRRGCSALASALFDAAELDRRVCRAEAQRRFDTDVMIRRHLDLYNDLLKTGTALPDGAKAGVGRRKLTIGSARLGAERVRSIPTQIHPG